MEKFVKEMGFDSVEEFNNLVAGVDLSTPEKLNDFNEWKTKDGTKNGLLNLKNK